MLNVAKPALIALALLAAFPASAEDKSAAMVNGVSIPQSRVDARVKAMAAQGQPDTPEVRKGIKDSLINLEVLSQAAAKQGLDKSPEVLAQIELIRQNVLADAYVQDYIKTHPVSEDAMKAEFNRLKGQASKNEYKARHILVKTEAEAKELVAQLKKGAKFEKLAAKSMDPGSAKQGGDLGWADPKGFVKEFADALVSLNKGQVSEPVQTQFGWHVIRLDDTREHKTPDFEQVKPQIAQHLQQQQIQQAVTDLRAAAKIE
ncbi:putative parvulin-type peptidyl-prolyl cis-trans isomerase [Ferriphaselus amnicola]|uniref:peptidylprolyl isomerase n=1 Tax=Ferriphaselus amnicola TaxID=1188319 RepID=A0A2Z6GBL2_9PROT|nr:peptidylprolyl isomerase [Ferriphaselus amnicola]BBE50780.1 putative parvulin-type peptidyl-prolyl cis-trans isomerase [Ferriphaselus amnicola]